MIHIKLASQVMQMLLDVYRKYFEHPKERERIWKTPIL